MRGITQATISAYLMFLIFAPFLKVYAEDHHDHGHNHEHGHEHPAQEIAKGPHGGRLFTDDTFGLEVSIFEKGIPPEFRLYAYDGDRTVEPTALRVSLRLQRLGRAEENFKFHPEAKYLRAEKIVDEPHSFDVELTAEYKGKQYSWKYASHEGRTELSEQALKVADLKIRTVEAQEISNSARVYGRLLPNEDRVAHIVPRFAGVVRQIRKSLGDSVQQGELLAVVESNQSMQPYEIRSQIAGSVVKRHATLGEFVSDQREIFIVADLSEIWADFQVYRDDFEGVVPGQTIKIDLGNLKELEARVAYISPLTDPITQSKLVRAVVPNLRGELRPGLFVTGTLSSNNAQVALAVHRDAVQSFRDWQVVFITDGHSFQAMPVQLGRKDSTYVEILSGLQAGDRYVAQNSFIIKADIEKSGATHDH